MNVFLRLSAISFVSVLAIGSIYSMEENEEKLQVRYSETDNKRFVTITEGKGYGCKNYKIIVNLDTKKMEYKCDGLVHCFHCGSSYSSPCNDYDEQRLDFYKQTLLDLYKKRFNDNSKM